MQEKQKGIAAPENHDKDNHISTTYKVLEILKSGQKVTAFALDKVIMYCDARKDLSDLRKKGYPIKYFLIANNRRVHYLPSDWERIMAEAEKNKPKDLFSL